MKGGNTMEIKKLTTITAMRTRHGFRIAYTYSTISEQGETIRRNIRGSLVVTKAMEEATAAVKALEGFLTARLPEGDKTGVLTSFCIFQSTEGTMITYLYDEIDANGGTATKNNQTTMILVEGYMDDQIAAAEALRAFLKTKL